MAVHSKNPSFAELQKNAVASSVQNTFGSLSPDSIKAQPMQETSAKPVEIPVPQPVQPEKTSVIKTVTSESGEKKRKDVLIGIHVTEDERNELRKMFCSNGFSLATAYRAAMTYLRQDIELGKAYITSNGEIFRK